MNVPENLLYTKEHEWVKMEGNKATIGITDYAQEALGDITFVELPKEGDNRAQFKELGTIESVKAASSVYAPLSGTIVKVNNELAANPELVNKFPYDKGWFVVIEIANESEKNNLLDKNAYEKHLKEIAK